MTAADADLDAAWLVRQRWFRSKQRRIAALTEVDRADLPPATLTVLEVAYADGGAPDRYLVPLVDGREPADGDGAWSALVDAIGRDAVIEGHAGRFVATAGPAFADLRPDAPTERRLGVEQSNTSVVVGDRLILKLYRLLEPGENPDVEVGTFLTDVGFADTPAVAGAIRYVAEGRDPAAAAMLQAYVRTSGDGWATMLKALANDADQAARLTARLGTLTARMHGALASRPEHVDFPLRVASADERRAWRASAEAQLAQAVASVSGAAHERLVALAPRVLQRFEVGFGSAGRDEVVSRIHGDYHLGQLLARQDGGFSVIDFEGEPARPLAERRRPGSPLRDVAGMLRSLDYAARTAERSAPIDADTWLPEARTAFLDAYGSDGPLVEAFELEKACYEMRYEANNRPDWQWLPLDAIERLAGAS